MKRLVLAMAFGLIFPRLLVAQDINVDRLLGDSWYGLYLNGEKSGFALMSTQKDAEGRIAVVQDAHFRLVMENVPQDLQIYAKRVYAPSGELIEIKSHFVDPSGKENSFDAHVAGDSLILKTSVGGVGDELTLPKPKESLADALRQEEWVLKNPQVGDKIEFSLFEPMFQRELNGVSEIIESDERVLDGVPTKVYRIRTLLTEMGLESVSYVAQNGSVLEDVAAGMFTMRLEPEEVAKDVDYNNDVIVSNAARVDKRIDKPRERDALRLELRGALVDEHLFSDERQTMLKDGDHVDFYAKRLDLTGFAAAKLPIEGGDMDEWLKPTPYVQCDDERLKSKAKEIAGDETDSLIISNKLCAWVYENMRSTYSARLTNAIEVLESLEGDCTEHSILFIGLARAIGLPAREIAGVVYVDGRQPGFYFHQWAKVWVGKWIDVDPTFNQPVADVTHIKFAEGDLFTQSKIIPLIGHLQVAYDPDAPQTPPKPGAAAEQAAASEEPATETPAAAAP